MNDPNDGRWFRYIETPVNLPPSESGMKAVIGWLKRML